MLNPKPKPARPIRLDDDCEMPVLRPRPGEKFDFRGNNSTEFVAMVVDDTLHVPADVFRVRRLTVQTEFCLEVIAEMQHRDADLPVEHL